MTALVGALVLFLLGLAGARLSFTAETAPLGPRFFFIAGTHFLLIGLLLGPHMLGLLTPAVIEQLFPLLALGLGWVGLLFGLQLDRRQLGKLPGRLLAAVVVQGIVAFAVFYALGLGLLTLVQPLDGLERAALFAAAATACVSSPLAIVIVSNAASARGRVSELLLLIASLDAGVGIVAIQLAASLYHAPLTGMAGLSGGLQWLALATALGAAFGILFLWLTRPKPAADELTLFLLGLVFFTAGAAIYLAVSTLFVAMIAGAVVANLSPIRRRVYAQLQAWEKPIYVILLTLMGALLDFVTWIVLPLALGYAVVRVLSKIAAGWSARLLVPQREGIPPLLGLGLVAQGGITLAIALGIAMGYGPLGAEPRLVSVLVSTVMLGVVLSELVGPFFTRRLLVRAAETAPPADAVRGNGP